MNSRTTVVVLLLILASMGSWLGACRSGDTNQTAKPPTMEVPSYTRTTLPFRENWWPTVAAAGDLDGDGRIDLAIAGRPRADSESDAGNADMVRLYFSKPGRGYRIQDLTVPRNVRTITLADINGDGALDILTANGASRSISVFRGGRSGRFEPRIDWPTDRAVIALAAADLDGDGVPDLATVSEDGSVGIGHNDGGGTFGQWRYRSGDHPASGLVAADADDNGKADLFIPHSQGGTVALLLQREKGRFEKAPPSDIVGRHAGGAAVADFNGDGIVDIAVPVFERGSVHILLGSGQGRFRLWKRLGVGPSPRHVATADLNKDGLADLIVTTNAPDHLVLLYSTVGGGFAGVRPLPSGPNPVTTVAADFNGDDLPDLAVVNSEADFVTLLTSVSTPSWKAVSAPNGPFSGGRTVSGPAPLYDDAIAAFKRGAYFETLRLLRRVHSKLTPEFLAGRIGHGNREEDRQIYVASVLLMSDIHRYYTGEPKVARDIELKLAADAAQLGQSALAAAEYLSVADIEGDELHNKAASIQALVRLEELVGRKPQGGEVPRLLADIAKLRIDRLHRGLKGYRARLPSLVLPYSETISGALLLRVVLPHLDAYGEPSSGPALYKAFSNTHPRSFRAVIAEYLGLREELSGTDVAGSLSLGRDFAKRYRGTLLTPIVEGEVLAHLRSLGDKAAQASAIESIGEATTELGIRASIQPSR